MNTFDTVLMWLAAISAAAVADHVWVRHIRPRLAPIFGWRDLEPDEIIPAYGWCWCLGFTAVVIVLMTVLRAAGY